MWQTLSMTSEIDAFSDLQILIRELAELTDLEDGTRFPSVVAVLCVPKDATFAIRVVLEVFRGKPEMLQFEVSGFSEPLNATKIDSIPVNRVVDAIVKAVAVMTTLETQGGSTPLDLPTPIDSFPAAQGASRAFNRKGVSITDDDLKKVAEIYRSRSTGRHKAVANYFPVSVRTASRYIKKARERGYLQEGE